MRLGKRTKYPKGGTINTAYPDLVNIVNPRRKTYPIYSPKKEYTPGQNASSGRASSEVTDDIIMAMLPLPPVGKAIQLGAKGYKALKAAGKAEQIAAEVAAKQVELDAQAAASQLATQTLKGRQPLVTKRQLSSYDDPTRPHTSIPAAIKGMDRGSDYKDIYHGEDLLGKERENTVRELITQELKNNPKSFVKDLGRPDLANLPDDKIRNIINVNDEVRRHLKDIYYKDTRQPLKGIDAYQQLTVNKHGGKLKKRNYTPSNMEAFHQANDAHLTSGPFLQRNGMSFQNGGKPTNVNYTDPQSFLTANGAYLDSLNYYNAARDFSSKFDALNPNHDEAGTNRKIEWLKTPEGQRLDSTMDAAAGRLFERNLPRGIYSPPMPTSPKTKPVFIPPNKRFPQGGTIAPYVTKNPNDPRIQAYRDSLDLYLDHNRPSLEEKEYPSLGIARPTDKTPYGEKARTFNSFWYRSDGIKPIKYAVNKDEKHNIEYYSPKFKKPVQEVILQKEQQMPKDTIKVPSTPPTKRVVQSTYRDARPYYQEEQMKDYEKTGKLDSSKVDAHKRWLKEQGQPNKDTNLLPYKYPYGGTMNSLGQVQGVQQIEDPTQASAVQKGIGSFGPWGAAISGVSQAGTKIAGNSATGQAFTSGVLDPSRTLGSLNDKRFNTGEKLLSFAAPFTYGLMKAKKDKRTQGHNDVLTNSEGFQDSGFMAQGGPLNVDPYGRVVTSRFAGGGNIQRVRGGVMHDEGYGIEHAYGAPHEQGGMDYTNNAEIQGGEKVIDGEYVITDEPGSQLDKTQMSISRRLDKNTKALSHRNDGEIMKMATDKLKAHAVQQNEEYLTVRNNERDTKLRNAIRRAIKKYGGDLETLDAEMQMRDGGNISSRGSKWMLEDGTGRKKLSDYGADPSVFAADYMSGSAYDAQRAGINPSSSVAYAGAPMANYGQKMFANNDAYSGYRGYDGLPGYSSMAATPPNVNTNNTGTTYGRWASDTNTPATTTGTSGQGWKNAANTAMDLAPVIANTIAGLSKADKVKASKYYTKYMNPELMRKDFEPIKRGIAGSQYGLRNSGMYSRAGQASIAAQGAKAMGDYSFNVDQTNTGIKNQFKGLNSQIETGNRGIDWQSDMFNFQAKDARRNYLMQAAGDLSKYSQNKQNYNRDQDFLELAYPEYARIMRSKRGQ